MKKLNKIFLVVGLMGAFAAAEAQTASPVDFMRMNPYQMKTNPAADLPYRKVVSVAVGNIGLDIQNTTQRYDNLFEFDAQGYPVALDMRKFANSLKAKNFFGFDETMSVLTYYRRLNRGMLTVDYGVKAHGDVVFNDGLFKLLGYGNAAFVGENNPAVVTMDMNLQAYQELAVGYQWNLTEQLSLGGRAKLLFGFANITTDAFDARLYTDADTYALRVQEDIAMRMATPRLLYADEGRLMADGLFRFGDLFHNPGFGVDLAAEYRFNDKFSAVAAVHDLGFIYWGLNSIKMTSNINDAGQFYDNGSFLFNGLDFDQVQMIVNDDYYRERFMDTLQQYFQTEFNPTKGYATMLNMNILLRGNYDLDAHNRFSLQAQGRFLGSGFRPSATLAYSGSFFNMLDVCATYTVMPGSFDNIGLGVAGNFGSFHIYLATSNVIGLFKPMNASAFGAQAGIVFNLRQAEKRIADKSGIPGSEE